MQGPSDPLGYFCCSHTSFHSYRHFPCSWKWHWCPIAFSYAIEKRDHMKSTGGQKKQKIMDSVPHNNGIQNINWPKSHSGFCSSIPSKNRMRPVWFSQNTKRNLNRPAPKDAVIMSSGSGPFLLHLKPFIFKKRQTSGDHAGCCQLATHRRDLAWKVWVMVCQNSCLYVQSHVENVLH